MAPRTLGVIPARGGSKRIPRKNLKRLCGKPLIAWTIEACAKSGLTNWVVSTEDYEIAQLSVALGAYVVSRPEELADDLSSTDSVALHALHCLGGDFDILCLLHPTSPVRDPGHIDECVSLLWASKAPSIASVEYAKRSYRHNASIYAAKVPFKTLYGDKTIPYLMDKAHSVDIDDETDFAIAETILGAREKERAGYKSLSA